jgi:hypothetical protein
MEVKLTVAHQTLRCALKIPTITVSARVAPPPPAVFVGVNVSPGDVAATAVVAAPLPFAGWVVSDIF